MTKNKERKKKRSVSLILIVLGFFSMWTDSVRCGTCVTSHITWLSPRTPCLCLCCPSTCGTWQTRPHWPGRRCWAHWAERSHWAGSSWWPRCSSTQTGSEDIRAYQIHQVPSAWFCFVFFVWCCLFGLSVQKQKLEEKRHFAADFFFFTITAAEFNCNKTNRTCLQHF